MPVIVPSADIGADARDALRRVKVEAPRDI